MAEIDVDTIKMRECGNDIMQLATEIGQEFSTIFDRINGMNSKTFEWTGKAADAYISRTSKEKLQYFEFKDILYQYGKYLVDSSNDIDSTASKVKK